jgi:hypothetical protein
MDLDQHGNGIPPRLDGQRDREQSNSIGTRSTSRHLGRESLATRDVVNALAERLGLADAPAQVKAPWARYVDSKPDGSSGYWQNTSAQVDQKARGLIHLMLTSSDYHLC